MKNNNKSRLRAVGCDNKSRLRQFGCGLLEKVASEVSEATFIKKMIIYKHPNCRATLIMKTINKSSSESSDAIIKDASDSSGAAFLENVASELSEAT